MGGGGQREREREMTNITVAFGNFAKELKFIRSAHTLYLCVLCGSQNKQPLFPCTILTDWFL